MDFKHKYEIETGNSIYSGNRQRLPQGAYSDEFVEYLLKQLTIPHVVWQSEQLHKLLQHLSDEDELVGNRTHQQIIESFKKLV